MPGYSQMQRAPAPQKAADGGAADHRTETAGRDHSPGADALSESLNQNPQVQSLLQMRRALDEGPRVQSELALQRALNRREAGPAHNEAAEASLRPASPPVQRKPNATGMPARLKAGVEHLSGLAMDDVRVNTNSSKPATVQAHAYTQGTNIYVAPGQEQHLPHEAWHVVQQKQGRVKPTLQMKGMAINDDGALERDADRMGTLAHQIGNTSSHTETAVRASRPSDPSHDKSVVQRFLDEKALEGKDPSQLKALADGLHAKILALLEAEAAKGKTQEARKNAAILIDKHIKPSLKQGWVADTYGYIRELAMMSSLSESGRTAVGDKSADLDSHADVTWQSPASGLFAAQMKTIEKSANLPENLRKASDQLGGKVEKPNAAATLVVDIAIDQPIAQGQLDADIKNVREAIQKVNDEGKLLAHSIRVRWIVQIGERMFGERVISFNRTGSVPVVECLALPRNRGRRPLANSPIR